MTSNPIRRAARWTWGTLCLLIALIVLLPVMLCLALTGREAYDLSAQEDDGR